MCALRAYPSPEVVEAVGARWGQPVKVGCACTAVAGSAAATVVEGAPVATVVEAPGSVVEEELMVVVVVAAVTV
jgi:hypothetical protein